MKFKSEMSKSLVRWKGQEMLVGLYSACEGWIQGFDRIVSLENPDTAGV